MCCPENTESVCNEMGCIHSLYLKRRRKCHLQFLQQHGMMPIFFGVNRSEAVCVKRCIVLPGIDLLNKR